MSDRPSGDERAERRTPREFLKARRPHLFSDSELTPRLALERKVLEYHLQSITSRKEEVEFENYCRKIAQREICPNLRPQTGPTGGGDSKADSSSYAVDADLARRVFWGSAAQPTAQRWCFAFSAKKAWTGKVRSDVKGLVQTVPPPDKIFFITNQFARDKTRAALEAELFEQYGVPVEILDREWLLTKTYENGHVDLAEECFHLGVDSKPMRRMGPNDASREAELVPLLERLRAPDEHYTSTYVLVEEYLRAAELARGVERPRHEVEGLLSQAARLADGTTPDQLLRARYALGWTAYWWFEDPQITLRAYEEMESALGSLQEADHLELYSNLLNVLMTAMRQGKLSSEAMKPDERFEAVRSAARRLEANDARPANALLARTQRAMLEVGRAAYDDTDVETALDEIHECITSADGLIHYPLLGVTRTLAELEEVLASFEGYDRVFRALCDLRGRLLGDRERAEMLLRNGYRMLKQERYAHALRELGEARRCILDKDSVLLRANISAVTALVYEASALYWAARMELVTAAHLAIGEAKRSGYASRRATSLVIHLIWIELRLGRIPCALAWCELAGGLVQVLRDHGEDVDAFESGLRSQDMVLSLFFLAADEPTLRLLCRLPDTLERLGLLAARRSLLFALGHEETLWEEDSSPLGLDAPKDLYQSVFDQPAFAEIPAGAPSLHARRLDAVSTELMGMTIRIEHENEVSSIALAENLISAVEAWFATATWDDMVFVESDIVFRVRASQFDRVDFPDVQDLVSGDREIRVGADWAKAAVSKRAVTSAFHDWVLTFLAALTARAMPRADGGMDAVIRGLAESESFSRALTYLPIHGMTLDELGDAGESLEHWESGREYGVLRPSAWWREAHAAQRDAAVEKEAPRPSHRPRVTVESLIEIERWDRAGWHAAMQAVVPDSPYHPPVLGLVFRDVEEARTIFRRLRERLERSGGGLRVAVILGEGGRECTGYAITIGTVLPYGDGEPPDDFDPERLVVTATRGLVLRRTTDTINVFVDEVRTKGGFLLMPADPGLGLLSEVAIELRELVVRNVGDVGERDPDGFFARQLLREHRSEGGPSRRASGPSRPRTKAKKRPPKKRRRARKK